MWIPEPSVSHPRAFPSQGRCRGGHSGRVLGRLGAFWEPLMVMEGYLFPGSLRSLNLHYATQVQWRRFLTLRHDFATSKKHLSSHVSTLENYMRLSRGKAVSSHFRMKASLTLGSARLFEKGSDSGADQTIPRTKWRLLAAFLQVARSAGLPKCNLPIVTIGSLGASHSTARSRKGPLRQANR